MKKTFHFLLVFLSSAILFSCSYDDTFIKDEIEKLKSDMTSLKSQVGSMQTIVDALNAGKVITKVDKLEQNKGYKITFNDGSAIEVKNGEKAPVIGVQQEQDIYYWTITTNGKTEFLLDKDNKKLPVTGNKGADGKDAVAPELGIDADGYWTVNNARIKDANDNFVKAEGNSFFKEIKDEENQVIFVLADDSNITIPKSNGTFLHFVGMDDGEPFFVLKPGGRKSIKFQYANLKDFEIVSLPAGWRSNIHVPNKYVEIVAPKDAGFGIWDVKLQAIDDKGMVYMAVVKVSIGESAFADAGGVYVLNEGNMTTETGSLIYITPEGQVLDNIYYAVNGKRLGNVTQDLYIKDGKIWILAQNGKVSATGNAFENEGMLVVADAKTMKRVAVYDKEFCDDENKYVLSWPTHIAVLDDNNVFIRDNHGVSHFNSETKELALIEGSQGAAKNRMAVANNKVFVINSTKLMVFEANKKEIVHTIDMGQGNKISGVVTAKDGNLWVSTTGNPNKISKVNSKTYAIVQSNEILEGKVGAGWGATPGISAKGDTIYYSNASTTIYRHIFSQNASKMMVDVKTLVEDANQTYNNLAVHPVTGDVYVTTIKGWGWDFRVNNISVINFDDDDTPILKANYKDHTSFPAGVFFTASFN